jgi:metal-responsive CopG/Arc/MetJ family transcriptional regulator
MCMNTAVEEQKRTARVSGVSFAPDVWDYLNEEVERQGHRNRSLVIENAIKVYRQVQTGEMELVPPKKRNGVAS